MKIMYKNSTVVFFIIALSSGLFLLYNRPSKRQADKAVEQVAGGEPWMTVFVHGSFSSILSLLNLNSVWADKISGTFYRRLTRGMRDDPFFFRDQPILQRGLIRVEPSFDPVVSCDQCVAYPLAKAYDEVSNAVHPHQELNYFYTFGWSGLVSQNSRRFEAVRLYNLLNQELSLFHKKGIYPKIRLICHSHGGNVCLNLAAINTVLAVPSWNDGYVYSHDNDQNKSLQAVAQILKSLPSREYASSKLDQKRHDYVPIKKDLIIDQLIMFGVPVQPETECFYNASTFRNIYHFYSEQDRVQRADWLSSKKSLSAQRLSKISKNKEAAGQALSNIIQVRLMIERPIAATVEKATPSQEELAPEDMKELTLVEELLKGRNIFVRDSIDPTHKELWFIMWKKDELNYTSFLAPLPIVILTPLLLEALHGVTSTSDVDINLCADGTQVKAYLTGKGRSFDKQGACMPRDVIEHIKEQLRPWQPASLLLRDELNAVYRHLV